MNRRVPFLILFLLVTVYVVNWFTPLRLTNDTIRFLHMEESFESGINQANKKSSDFLPLGYVLFLLVLSKLHLLNSFFICFIQFCYLLGSIWFIHKICGVKFWILTALTMFSWLIIKFVITPLSEMQFLFFTTGALYFFTVYDRSKRKVYLLWTSLFLIIAVFTRTVGIILVPAFILTLLIQSKISTREFVRRNLVLLLLAIPVTLLVLVFSNVLRINDYMQFFTGAISHYPSHFFSTYIKMHLIDWATVFINIPFGKVIYPSISNVLYLVVGLASLIFTLYLLIAGRIRIPLLIKIFLISYIIIMLLWPFFEPRYWMPIVPLLIALAIKTYDHLVGTGRKLLIAFMIFYIVTGTFVLYYYTNTSLNKKSLAIKQDAARWRNEYETHFFGKPLSDTAKKIRTDVLEILKKYN